MRNCTNLSQSKDLKKYLPLNSADMYYTPPLVNGFTEYLVHPIRKLSIDWEVEQAIPCWSLTALINILPSSTLDISDDHYCRVSTMNRSSEWHGNPVDACVEMIKRLHNLGLMKNGKVRRH
jgi:hypothetical protein